MVVRKVEMEVRSWWSSHAQLELPVLQEVQDLLVLCRRLLHSLQSQGRSKGQASTGMVSHLRMVLLRVPSWQGWGSRALPLVTEWSISPLQA